MLEEHRYFEIGRKKVQALVRVDTVNTGVKVLECSNMESCYAKKVLTYGLCPNYCPIIADIKKYIFRDRKPKSQIKEVTDNQLIEATDPFLSNV
ncbi:MAG: hypothetical protein R6U44_09200 [Archaeoglobaceae archaeon]